MDFENFLKRFAELLPRLKTRIQLIGAVASLVAGISVHLWIPGAIVSQSLLILLVCLFLFFPLAFSAGQDLDPTQRLNYLIKLLLLSGVVLVVLTSSATLLAWYDLKTGSDSVYAIRVTVVDEQDQVLEDSEVHASVGGEWLRVPGGWECRLLRHSIPADGHVVFRGSLRGSFLIGKADVLLGNDHHPSIQIKLVPDTSAMARGTVIDGNGRPIIAAKVWVSGYPPVLTDDDGNFSLAAHVADGQFVKLYAMSKNTTVTQNIMAGQRPQTISLGK